jgi:hypothetical protein
MDTSFAAGKCRPDPGHRPNRFQKHRGRVGLAGCECFAETEIFIKAFSEIILDREIPGLYFVQILTGREKSVRRVVVE